MDAPARTLAQADNARELVDLGVFELGSRFDGNKTTRIYNTPLVAYVHEKNENEGGAGRFYTRLRTNDAEQGLDHGKFFFPFNGCVSRPGFVWVYATITMGKYGFFVGEWAEELNQAPAMGEMPMVVSLHKGVKGLYTTLKVDANDKRPGKYMFPAKSCKDKLRLGAVRIDSVEDRGTYGFFHGEMVPYRVPSMAAFTEYVKAQPDLDTWLKARIFRVTIPEVGSWIQVDRGSGYPLAYFAKLNDADSVEPRLDIEELVSANEYQRSMTQDVSLPMSVLFR